MGIGIGVALVMALFYGAVTYAIWVLDRREAGEFGKPSRENLFRFVKILLNEIKCATFFFALHPFGLLDPMPPSRRELQGRRPIVLVHGFGQTRSNMWLLGVRLIGAGLGPTYTVNLKPMSMPVVELSRILSRRIDEVMEATGASDVDVVAHSMGGIVARYVDINRTNRRVRRLVTIGTPHKGTRAAELSIWRAAADLRIGCEAIQRMPELEPGVIVAISSEHDNLVLPPENGKVGKNGTDVVVSGVGHLTMLTDPWVASEVIKALGEEVRSDPLVLKAIPSDASSAGVVAGV